MKQYQAQWLMWYEKPAVEPVTVDVFHFHGVRQNEPTILTEAKEYMSAYRLHHKQSDHDWENLVVLNCLSFIYICKSSMKVSEGFSVYREPDTKI